MVLVSTTFSLCLAYTISATLAFLIACIASSFGTSNAGTSSVFWISVAALTVTSTWASGALAAMTLSNSIDGASAEDAAKVYSVLKPKLGIGEYILLYVTMCFLPVAACITVAMDRRWPPQFADELWLNIALALFISAGAFLTAVLLIVNYIRVRELKIWTAPRNQ
ncbi:MAG: hypothetical protein AAGB29_13895 [Planctomycetota bacterium]